MSKVTEIISVKRKHFLIFNLHPFDDPVYAADLQVFVSVTVHHEGKPSGVGVLNLHCCQGMNMHASATCLSGGKKPQTLGRYEAV